jgi:hypothetical protein
MVDEYSAPAPTVWGSAWNLFRYLLLLCVIYGVACIYVWQRSSVEEMDRRTQDYQEQIRYLEEDNVKLMLQVAALNAPGYVRSVAVAQGMVPVQNVAYIQAPLATRTAPPTSAKTDDPLAQWWQNWTDNLVTQLKSSSWVPELAEMMKPVARWTTASIGLLR